MTFPRLALPVVLAAASCASPAPPPAVSSYCADQAALPPTYTAADLDARRAERNAALPEDYEPAELKILRRRPPSFPRCALERGMEGVCMVAFDITSEGTTTNILPVCSSRLFESDVKAIVATWAFEPPGDGPRPAIVNRIVYKLEDFAYSPPPASISDTEPE